MLDFACQGAGQVLRAGEGEADHVDDDVRGQRDDGRPELAGGLGCAAIDGHAADRLPGCMGAVGRTLVAADHDDLVAGFDQARHQVGADVTTATDDNDTHSQLLSKDEG